MSADISVIEILQVLKAERIKFLQHSYIDTTIQIFHEELRPFHKEIYESASYVLELLESHPAAARGYYPQTVQTNVIPL